MITKEQLTNGAILSNGIETIEVVEIDETTLKGEPITFVNSKHIDDEEIFCDTIDSFIEYMNEIGCQLK